jgi:hypothetical protein
MGPDEFLYVPVDQTPDVVNAKGELRQVRVDHRKPLGDRRPVIIHRDQGFRLGVLKLVRLAAFKAHFISVWLEFDALLLQPLGPKPRRRSSFEAQEARTLEVLAVETSNFVA